MCSVQRWRLTSVMLLIPNVANTRKPFIMNPAKIHLISDIPDPAAYFASDLTRCAAMNENMPCAWYIQDLGSATIRQDAHGKNYIYEPPCCCYVTPWMP